MPDYITTYTGLHMEPTQPDPNLIQIEDIAHALSLICRGNGHVSTFFSVGQHCLLAAREALGRGLSSRMALACLLHDAGEAYLSDVPRPLKRCLEQYSRYEDQLLEAIYEKYLGTPLTAREQAELKKIDDDLLYFDLRDLLHETPDAPEPAMQCALSHEVRPFEAVEREYLALFHRLKGDLYLEEMRHKAKCLSKLVLKSRIRQAEGHYQRAVELGDPDAGERQIQLAQIRERMSWYRQEQHLP